jgi:predicted transcriptional regulator
MVKNGLLRVNGVTDGSDAILFEVTEKGKEFLKAYKGLKALMK